MFVDDIVADADVDRDGDAEAVGVGEDADVGVRKVVCDDSPADVFSQAKVEVGGLGGQLVQLAGFSPEAEFAGADVARDAFGGGADAGEPRSRGSSRRR